MSDLAAVNDVLQDLLEGWKADIYVPEDAISALVDISGPDTADAMRDRARAALDEIAAAALGREAILRERGWT